MHKLGKWFLMVVLVIALAGCGGGDSPSSPGDTGSDAPEPTFTVVKIVPTNTPVPPPPTPAPTATSTPAPDPAPTQAELEPESEGSDLADTETEVPDEAGTEPEPEPQEPESSDMAVVPAGEFAMGSKEGDESPIHTIQLDDFEIDISEVTNAEFAKFVDDTGYETDAETSGDPNSWKTSFGESEENYPVVKVSWTDAVAYCEWAGKRLPSEAEWEKAARGTEGPAYPWGDEWDAAKANSKESGYRGPVAVGSFPDGASPYGLMDMAGNVWEWTADWYQGYPHTAFTSTYFGETYKVLRGGGWFSDEDTVRSAVRNANSPDAANDDIGFRCAR